MSNRYSAQGVSADIGTVYMTHLELIIDQGCWYRVRAQTGGFTIENLRVTHADGSVQTLHRVFVHRMILEGDLLPLFDDVGNAKVWDIEPADQPIIKGE